MKKTTLVLACIIFAVFSVQGQTVSEKPKDKKITFGLRTGYEFQVNDSNLSYKLNAPYFGVFSDISISKNKKWSIQLELNLRSENRERLFNDGFRESINELYLTVPVLLKYHVNDKFSVFAGTQVLSQSLVNDISGIKKWNGILGVEYHLTKKLFLDARFRHGFEGKSFINDFRDNRISIGIGYKF